MMLNLLFLTLRYAMEPKDIREGITHRYVGLYGSLAKILLRRSQDSKVFWYSDSDHSLRIFNSKGHTVLKKRMLQTALKAIFDTFKNRSYLNVIIAFPSGVRGIRTIFEYIPCLFLLRIFGNGRVRIYADDFDPAVEGARAFAENEPSAIRLLCLRALEMLTLKLSTVTIVVSEFWKDYMSRVYCIKKDRIQVISNGTLIRQSRHKEISSEIAESKIPFTVLYAGYARKANAIDKLVSVVANLREQGLCVNLNIAGSSSMDLPSWVILTQEDWPIFFDRILFNSDVCVIPYPANRFYFFHSSPAKLFDYMGAGKSIVSTDLAEVGYIIRTHNCGLVARNWKEFELHLKRLYEDKELAKNLGDNGRRAAEKYFNYELLAEELLENMFARFERVQ